MHHPLWGNTHWSIQKYSVCSMAVRDIMFLPLLISFSVSKITEFVMHKIPQNFRNGQLGTKTVSEILW